MTSSTDLPLLGFQDLATVPWVKTILGSLGDGIVVADSANRVLYMNPQAEKILGSALAKRMGQDIHACHKCPWKVDEVLKGVSPDHPFREEVAVGRRWVSITASPILSDAGEFLGSIMIVADTTARRELDETVQRQNQELMARQSRLDLQFELARSIQKALLPEELMRFNGFVARFWNRQSQVIGGDFGIVSPDPLGAWIILADVMGKGLSASQFVPLMHGFILDEIRATLSPQILLTRLNRRLASFIQERFTLFVTALAIRIDSSKDLASVSTAGHEGFYQIREGTMRPIDLGGTFPLGLQANPNYPVHEFSIAKGQTILLMSDGITEAEKGVGGSTRKCDWLYRLFEETPEGPERDVHSTIREYLLRYPPPDDQTLITFRKE